MRSLAFISFWKLNVKVFCIHVPNFPSNVLPIFWGFKIRTNVTKLILIFSQQCVFFIQTLKKTTKLNEVIIWKSFRKKLNTKNINGKFVEISKFLRCFWDNNQEIRSILVLLYLWNGRDRSNLITFLFYKKNICPKRMWLEWGCRNVINDPLVEFKVICCMPFFLKRINASIFLIMVTFSENIVKKVLFSNKNSDFQRE